jgi:hypothetical protein
VSEDERLAGPPISLALDPLDVATVAVLSARRHDVEIVDGSTLLA